MVCPEFEDNDTLYWYLPVLGYLCRLRCWFVSRLSLDTCSVRCLWNCSFLYHIYESSTPSISHCEDTDTDSHIFHNIHRTLPSWKKGAFYGCTKWLIASLVICACSIPATVFFFRRLEKRYRNVVFLLIIGLVVGILFSCTLSFYCYLVNSTSRCTTENSAY